MNSLVGAADVDRLLSTLKEKLSEKPSDKKSQEDLLVKVKVHGRNIQSAGPIFTQNYGLDRPAPGPSREALRCLANAFLLNEPSRQIFVDLGYGPKVANHLKSESVDDEFLVSRILFLLTYNTTLDFKALVDGHDLAQSINECCRRHAQRYGDNGSSASTLEPMAEMALTETVKLIFNITYFNPKLATHFLPSVQPIVNILINRPPSSPPLQPPVGPMLNALLNLDLSMPEDHHSRNSASSIPDAIFPPTNPDLFMRRLVSIFDAGTKTSAIDDLEQAAAPLCTLLRRFYELAPLGVKMIMQTLILPKDQDRDRPLGQGTSFPDRLLRLSASPKLPTLKDNISNLLFELSDKDPNQFVQNIGYGHASGFLISHNLQVSPTSAGEESRSHGNHAGPSVDVNPITGQNLASEARDAPSSTPMTDEEKEREAERLFVLFERLKATGVVDVKNPIEQARDEGRFEEVD